MGASTWAVPPATCFSTIQSVPVLFTLNAAILILEARVSLTARSGRGGHDLRQASRGAAYRHLVDKAFPWLSNDVNGCGAVATGEGLNEFVNSACGETIGTRNLLKPTWPVHLAFNASSALRRNHVVALPTSGVLGAAHPTHSYG